MSFKVYTDLTHYDKKYRGLLFELLKPYAKEVTVSSEELRGLYGGFVDDYEITDNISECNFAVLPMAWEYYYITGKKKLLSSYLEKVTSSGKKIFTQTCGDFGVTPLNKDVLILRANGYQSRRLINQHALSAFIHCPMKEFFNRDEIIVRDKQDQPLIGFCGQSVSSFRKNIVDVIRTIYRNSKYYAGISIYEPHALYPSTLLRQRVLEVIEKDNRLKTNFIKRDKYRAGDADVRSREETTREFYTNLLESDYGVCVRGGGNFSVRLYETLAMGRIPVFINTDCILPYDNIIDWKDYVVWVEDKEIDKIPEKILDFHSSLTNERFREMQIKCRKLWIDYLSMNGFMKHLSDLLPDAIRLP